MCVSQAQLTMGDSTAETVSYPQVSRSFGAGAQSVGSGLCIVPSTSTGYCLMTTGLRLLSKTALY